MTAVTEGTGRPDYKKTAAARRADRADLPGAKAAAAFAASGAMDELFAKIDAGEPLTGQDGLLGGMLKAALERGLETELTEHVGYDKHAVEGRNGANSRNGTRAKTVLTDNAGPIQVEVPRDRDGSFEPVIVKKRQRRLSQQLGTDHPVPGPRHRDPPGPVLHERDRYLEPASGCR